MIIIQFGVYIGYCPKYRELSDYCTVWYMHQVLPEVERAKSSLYRLVYTSGTEDESSVFFYTVWCMHQVLPEEERAKSSLYRLVYTSGTNRG